MNVLREQLSGHLNIQRIHEIYAPIQSNTPLLERLCALSQDEDKTVSSNALWVMTHFSKEDNAWLLKKHQFLIESVLQSTDEDTGKRRMLLSILAKHQFSMENTRTDFLNYCLEHATMSSESTANRCRCMELAFEQCQFYPELIKELESILELVGSLPMQPAVNCTRKKVLKKISNLSIKHSL